MSGRPLCEMCQWIDVRLWHRSGQLRPGLCFPCSWVRDGESLGNIWVETKASFVHLSFHTYDPEIEKWTPIEQLLVPVIWTSCHLGGGRPWFRCQATVDGQHCGRRVAKLYLAGTCGF